ncbi:MAG: hypothetical protein IKC51_04020 [Myxococcaceae bacterium]|nr:hypothetical protein [Myxococcaceae bacterium]
MAAASQAREKTREAPKGASGARPSRTFSNSFQSCVSKFFALQRPFISFALQRTPYYFLYFSARHFNGRFSAGQLKDASAPGSFFELEPHKLDLIY